MDLDSVTENADYYKNGYPETWQEGYAAGQAGFGIDQAEDSMYAPAWLDGHARGLRESQPTKENSMASTNPAVDLDDLDKQMDSDQAEAKAERTQSAGGFDLLAGMEDDLDKGSGKPWIAEKPGDQIIGVVEAVDKIRSDYADAKTGEYKMVPLLDIRNRDDNELYTVRGYGAALVSQIEKADPHVGDGIGIRFIGMEQPKTAGYAAYKNYTVKVIRAQQ
jgi:hypothetical protein